MSYITPEELEALQSSGLPRVLPFAISNVSMTQFSIARHYGGIKWQGSDYLYIQTTDELIRDDVNQWIAKRRRDQRKASRAKQQMEQATMI
jgi:hypothetical protein